MAEFKNLDVTDIGIFGKSMPKEKCWTWMLKKAGSFDTVSDKKAFEKSLKWNVEASYYRLVGITFKDLDTDTEWFASFIPDMKKWELEIPSSNKALISPDQKFDCYHNPEIKKIVEHAADVLTQAAQVCKEQVLQYVEAGELLSVDETKLDRILDAVDDKQLMANLKKGVFVR